MRLINVSTRRLEQFTGPKTPDYAILSHTWGSDADEVTFSEFNNGQCQMKKGFNKIVHLCEEATHRGIGYVWIDTCCIDSSSSAELSKTTKRKTGRTNGRNVDGNYDSTCSIIQPAP